MALLGSCQLPFPFPKQRPGRHRPVPSRSSVFFLHSAWRLPSPSLSRRGSALEAFLFRPLNPCAHAPCRRYWLRYAIAIELSDFERQSPNSHPELNLRFNSLPLSAMMSRNIRAADPPSRIDIIIILILTHGVSSLQSDSPRMSRHQIHCSTVPAGIRSLATT
ncbi:hypothetical protein GQ607_016185 [Colletotrichum asianum]|uniref:Uncharacterized protein n=1 Tax=Colletotrichum asianum TaxID=702518 RepID=A0A8H3VZW8_9PEZI|nr:hypothetical protein GQ607_016185 [Colletotrichum asianum]